MTNVTKTATRPSVGPVADEKRRAALKRIGRFAAVTPPTVALLLAAESKPAKAAPGSPVDGSG
jgi:hypothetical protein